MILLQVESLGVKVIYYPEEAIKDKDVIMVLRIQFERQSKILFPSNREYSTFLDLIER
jgi:aspartate carbamoyltransferase catalytic subunit